MKVKVIYIDILIDKRETEALIEFVSAILNSIPTNNRAFILNRNRYKTCTVFVVVSIVSFSSLELKTWKDEEHIIFP